MNRPATSLKRNGRYTLVWPILLGLLSFGDACVGQTPVENISGILRIVGAQYNVVETLAQQYAAVKDANGNQLAKPSTKVEEKTYEGNYAPPELRADLKGRFLYGLA